MLKAYYQLGVLSQRGAVLTQPHKGCHVYVNNSSGVITVEGNFLWGRMIR